MAVFTGRIRKQTKGFNDILDITEETAQVVRKSGLNNGLVTVFVPGSTAGITTIEFEPGLKRDLPEAFERIAPMQKTYHHDATWHDGNGFSHVRAAFIGPSLTIPIVDGTLPLGTWQQIVLIDFDNRSRDRRLVVQVMGEA